MAKQEKRGIIPCLLCGKPFKYLTTSHMKTHPPGYPHSDPEYREWAASRWDVPPEEVPLHPNDWSAARHRIEGWREDLVEVD